MMGTLPSSCSSMNLMTSRPNVMWRLSSLCAEKPNVIVARSPLKLAPLMNGTKSRLVRRYSKENEMEVRNSKGPAEIASSNDDLGTERYQTRSCIFDQSWKPP